MKNLSANIRSELFSAAPTVATAWLVTRRDGKRLGFTDYSKGFKVGGVFCNPRAGFVRTNYQGDREVTTDNLELSSVLDSGLITDVDLQSGKYDGASIKIFLVDLTNLNTSDTVELINGTVGEVTWTGKEYKAAGRSLIDKLNNAYSSTVTPLCSHSFCDIEPRPFTACRLARASMQSAATLTAISDDLMRFSVDIALAEGEYKAGFVEFLSGELAGSIHKIVSHTSSSVLLYTPLPKTIVLGASLWIVKGCNKSLADCKRHNNVINRAAFDFVPTSDIYRSRKII